MRKLRVLGIVLVCAHGFLWSQVSPANEVYVLQTGEVTPIDGRQLIPGVDEDNGGRYVTSTIGLVIAKNPGGQPVKDGEGNPIIIAVDPGFARAPEVGSYEDALRDALGEVNVEPEDVTHVFISHHHPDHTLNAGLFPNATLVDFWATYKGGLWEDHPDDYEIARGITVRRTPGHTHQDASLVVETGTLRETVVFTHVWWLILGDGTLFPATDPIAEVPGAMEASRDLVHGIADCIVPGHGAPFVNPEKSGATCDMVGIIAP